MDEALALITAGMKITWVYRNICQRIYLIAGNASIGQSYLLIYKEEPCTTIQGKPLYEGLKTQGLAVHAAKDPNVFRRPYGT